MPRSRDVGGTNAMWLDLFWGWSLLGCRRRRRGGMAGATPQVLPTGSTPSTCQIWRSVCSHSHLTTAVSARKHESLRTTPVPTSNHFAFPAPRQTWIDQRIEPMTPTGSSWDGAENKRGEIMALVNKTTFSISHPDSGSDHDSPPTR